MTIRNAVLGLAVVFGVALWSWLRPAGSQAKAQGSDPIVVSTDPGVGMGGNREEALARYRGNMSRHWRQVAIGGGGHP